MQDLLITIRNAFSGGLTGGGISAILVPLVLIAVFIILVVVVLYALYLRTPRGRVEALFDERASQGDTNRWPVRLTIVLFVVMGAVFLSYQMNQPAQCASCHTEVDYAATLAESTHAGVSCLSCHSQPGAVGRVAAVATYARWIFVYGSTKSEPEPRTGTVSSDRCLTCHREITGGTTVRDGIRVRHSDFLDTGIGCRDCHNSVAHGDEVTQPSTPAMNKCLMCHDGDTASSECELCHVDDPATYVTRAVTLPTVRNLDTGNCYACHDEQPCVSCHGVTMPHPANWGPNDGGPGQSGSHPYEGFKNRDVCWRCHFAPDAPMRPAAESCDECHQLFGQMHGGEAWIDEHWRQATGVKPGGEAQCFDCHGDYLCDQCHPPSYREKYNPVVGFNDYQRDIPLDPHYWEY